MTSLRNATSGALVTKRLDIARGIIQRAIGLLGRSRLGLDEGLWLKPCRAIHTVGMRFSIDIVFLDREDRVLRIDRRVPPNRLMVRCPGTASIIELAGGSLHIGAIEIRDRLEPTSLDE